MRQQSFSTTDRDGWNGVYGNQHIVVDFWFRFGVCTVFTTLHHSQGTYYQCGLYKKKTHTKKNSVVFLCFCCCRILRKIPSNLLSSRLLPPQLVPPSDTPTLSAPRIWGHQWREEGKKQQSLEQQGFSRQTLHTEASHHFFFFFSFFAQNLFFKKKVESMVEICPDCDIGAGS